MKKLFLTVSLFIACGFYTENLQAQNQKGWRQYTTDNSTIPSNMVNTTLVTSSGVVWLGTEDGLSKYDNGSFTTYTTTNGLEYNQVKQILEDQQGNLWIGYGNVSGKLTQFDGNSFTTFSSSQGLSSNGTSGLYKLGNSIAVKTTSSLYVLDNGTFNAVNVIMQKIPVQLNDTEITYFRGTGLYRYDGSSETQMPTPGNIISGFTPKMYSPSSDELFVRSYDSSHNLQAYHYINGAFTPVTANPSLGGNLVYVGKEGVKDNNGNYWTNGTKSFLYHLIGHEQKITSVFNGYSATAFFDLDVQNETLFVSSDSGLIVGNINNDENTLHELDINNLRPVFKANGALTGDDDYGMMRATKNNEGHTLMFGGSLWMGAKDQSGQLYVAAENFPFTDFVNTSSAHNDFVPGPIGDNTQPRLKYAKAWKISKTEIQYHIYNYMNSGYVAPDGILDWPAHGNTTEGEAQCLAPFHDMNQDGQYNPTDGDYPFIRGDQAIYAIYNDVSEAHNTGGRTS